MKPRGCVSARRLSGFRRRRTSLGIGLVAIAISLSLSGVGTAAERPVHCGRTADSTETYRVTVHRTGEVRCAEARAVARGFTGGAGRRHERADGTVVAVMGRGWRCYTPGDHFSLEHCRRVVPRSSIIIRTLIIDEGPQGDAPGPPGGFPVIIP